MTINFSFYIISVSLDGGLERFAFLGISETIDCISATLQKEPQLDHSLFSFLWIAYGLVDIVSQSHGSLGWNLA